MIRKLYLIAILLIASITLTQAQSGSIQGKILDSAKNEGIPFANVVAEQNGVNAGGAQTDFDGNYVIKPLQPGKYDIKVSYVGFQSKQIVGVPVSTDHVTFRDIQLSSTINQLKVITVVADKIPVFEKDNVTTGGTVGSDDIHEMPRVSLQAIASTVAGVYDDGSGGLNFRGARSDATAYYVDGIKVIGSANISKDGIDQVEVLTGGLPASIGDVAGGVVRLTTKGPSREVTGGAEFETSELLDAYGHNLAALNVSGPLFMRKDASGTKRPVAGYFIVAEYSGDKDASPSAVGTYKVKPSTLSYLEANPIRPQGLGLGYNDNSDYVTADQLDHLKYKDNAASKNYKFSGKLDFKPSSNTDIILGGSIDHNDQHNWIYVYSLYNSFNNPQQIDNTYRAFGRFTQRFNPDTASKSIIKNAFYSIQFDVSKNSQTVQNDQFKQNIFDYGQIGKFNTYKMPVYGYGKDQHTGLNGFLLAGFADTMVTFTPSTVNPIAAEYTTEYFNLAGSDKTQYNTLATIQANGGLLNGDRPHNIYGLWYNTGRVYNGYSYFNNDQYRVSASGSADVGKHAITLGFEYEQRVFRDYTINPIGLWTLMRQLANKHLTQLDTANPIKVMSPDGTTFLDTIKYNRFYDASNQANFDKNLRVKLGMAQNGLNWIDIDSYGPETYSLDMFSVDELQSTGSYVSYYGYDYLGNKLTTTPSFNDYFTQKDSKGNYTRPKAAFMPIYVAGYIQDKFVFNDLIFNVGLRIDRYDANQKVLKDRYSLYATHTASDSKTKALAPVIPQHIGDNFVVYVNDLKSPTSVVGYRDPTTNFWYDAQGNQLSDPSILAKSSSTGTITPYLINPDDDIKSPNFVPDNSFTNYSPQISVMPRISFSFPISDEALFFAHYDVLTQRPSTGGQMDPTAYFYMTQESGGLLNNPNLKPEQTTDYELGFKQRLSKSSSFTLSAFYRELRNNIEVVNVLDAYPVTYKTFDNVDFGTVKGLTLSYDLRRTQNVRLTASYTLQFAVGTGSAATSGYNIINLGEPNLVVPTPLNFDQRHALVTSIDYRFGSGIGDDEYSGPILFGKKLLASTGFNFIFHAGSGTPYTRQSNIAELGSFDQNLRTILSGSINGSRLPWQFRIDAKVDRDIVIKSGKKQDEVKKMLFLNIYLQVDNVLNTQNITSVYPSTGNASDDGFLSAAANQQTINQQISPQAFTDLYKIKINDPTHYSLPRRIRLGASLNF